MLGMLHYSSPPIAAVGGHDWMTPDPVQASTHSIFQSAGMTLSVIMQPWEIETPLIPNPRPPTRYDDAKFDDSSEETLARADGSGHRAMPVALGRSPRLDQSRGSA